MDGARWRRRENDNPHTLWGFTLLTLKRFPSFRKWRFGWEGLFFCAKVSKRLESGVYGMPKVREGCTSMMEMKLLAKRGRILKKMGRCCSISLFALGGTSGPFPAATAHFLKIGTPLS